MAESVQDVLALIAEYNHCILILINLIKWLRADKHLKDRLRARLVHFQVYRTMNPAMLDYLEPFDGPSCSSRPLRNKLKFLIQFLASFFF